ncbi:MGMT family protein [Georgenia sp. 10Sc9-8]|uniref:MGMT family protein n=1 Tax=Georgenia halotolerans TaxID=3028317 RepID=A0ABT5TW28_9MICO|nr:MGMT family protein [Georgenia halotolerans]
MASERVFTVSGKEAIPAEPVSLSVAGLHERADLQEWVLQRPEILGPDVLVVTFEFDRWQTASGDRQMDRLDVLGLDSNGRLVVAELKRDRAPDTVQMQAIKYAAMCSRFTEDDLVAHYARFLQKQTENPVSEDVARDRLLEHAGELDPDQLRQPRIVLVAGSFTPVSTASVVWLSEMGLDITLQRVQAYRVASEHIVVTVSQLFPIPDVEEFTVSPQRQEAQSVQSRRKGTRERSTVVQLVASRVIEDGTALRLRPTTEVTAEVREQVIQWVGTDPRRGRAVWHNDRSKPLEWEYDGGRYRPTEIVRSILSDAAGLDRSVRGPSWWVLEDGRDLPSLAGSPQKSSFDWSELHTLMGALPYGRWTTYGDVASVIGTAPQPLGQHIMHCNDCENAQRVLGADGRPSPGFTSGQPGRTESQQEVLEAEGVTFLGDRADASRRIPLAHLEGLVQD